MNTDKNGTQMNADKRRFPRAADLRSSAFICVPFFYLVFVVATAFSMTARADEQRWWSYVQFLAGDKLAGRDTGSPGERAAGDYVVARFENAGLKPGGKRGYFQPVRFRSRRLLEEQCSVALAPVPPGKTASAGKQAGTAVPLELGEDIIVSSRGRPVESLEAPLVFVGYGLVMPEAGSDNLSSLNLRGKVAVYLVGAPSTISAALRAHFQSERWKHLQAAGAVGTIAIPNPGSADIPWERLKLARSSASLTLTGGEFQEAGAPRLTATFNPSRAEKLFAGSGHLFADVLKLAADGKRLPSFPLAAAIRTKLRIQQGSVQSRNVIGILPGSDPKLSNEFVVLSAHIDHLGTGRPINGDAIYNGAMDNASGVAALLEVAASLRDAGRRPRRSLVFTIVTAEEKGLLGSRYFAARPTVRAGRIVADVNIDMFLPLFPLKLLNVPGLEESTLGDQLRQVAGTLGIGVQPDPQPERNSFIRSDQYSFVRRGIPSLTFKVGFEKDSPQAGVAKKWLAERYHAPSDDLAQPVDLKAAGDFTRVLQALVEAIADQSEAPRWRDNSYFRRYQKK